MDKTLEMRCKIEAVFEHYAEQLYGVSQTCGRAYSQ